MRCDAKTGYVNQFDFYLGKKNTQVHSKFGLYFQIIDELTKSLRGTNVRLYFDSLYTSIPLLLHLQNHKIWAAGTLRKNKKYLPPEIRNPPAKMSRGEHLSFQDSNNPHISCSVWMDQKHVRFCSNFHKPNVITTCMRRIRSTYVRLNIPQVRIAK